MSYRITPTDTALKVITCLACNASTSSRFAQDLDAWRRNHLCSTARGGAS
jgi:hypothetical protein